MEMKRNPKPQLILIMTLLSVFILGQGCASLTAFSSPVTSTPQQAEPPARETPPRSVRSPMEERGAYYEFLLGSLAENQEIGRASCRERV